MEKTSFPKCSDFLFLHKITPDHFVIVCLVQASVPQPFTDEFFLSLPCVARFVTGCQESGQSFAGRRSVGRLQLCRERETKGEGPCTTL